MSDRILTVHIIDTLIVFNLDQTEKIIWTLSSGYFHAV